MPVTYVNGKPTCACGNGDPAKFRPESVKSTANPLAGINLRCLACNTLHDMSKPENQKP